jgi:protein-S-isoprenylcysteine O-methyltransferase Ste14
MSAPVIVVLWLIWCYPFLFRAPHRQKRPSITAAGPSRIGLVLESVAIGLVALLPRAGSIGRARLGVAVAFWAVAPILSWTAVTHLGKQFRVQAGLYEDHELVQTGPYAIVRHPIYASLFAMLLATMLLLTPWRWMPLPIVLFVVGTEIRVRTEDALLASRFGDQFRDYQLRVSAYLPFIR